MSTSDLLTKLVLHEKQIVTYRTLSRQQSIHVNQAKNELAAFYEAQKPGNAALHATFVVTGSARAEPKPMNGTNEDDMDLDVPSSSQPQEPEPAALGPNKVVMCSEEALETAKAGFARLRSVHVYSLSVATIKDPSMLATTLESVRASDASATQDQLRERGIVIGDVGAITSKSSAKGKNKAAQSAPAAPAPTKTAPAEKKPDVPEKKSTSRTGTLNFGAAKAKEEIKPAAVVVLKEEVSNKEPPKPKVEEKQPSPPPQPQRSGSGVGRKRGIDDEEEPPAKPAPRTKSTTTAKPKSKQRLSAAKKEDNDEADAAPVPPPSKKANGKSSKAESDVDASLAAMFDDASDVEMQPATAAPESDEEVAKEEETPKEEEKVPEEVDEQEEEDESHGIDKQKTKRRAKAKPQDGAIVMKDGKKKKRVVKSKMTTNERGYMVMEDYSEYETVSESEELTVPEKPKKAAAKKEAKPKEEETKPKPKPRSSATAGGKKGGGKLSDYFGKK